MSKNSEKDQKDQETPKEHLIPHFSFDCAHCTPMPKIRNTDGTTRLAPITVEWHRYRMVLAMPFGRNSAEINIDGLEVGEARNQAVKMALEHKCKYLFFLDYDVLPPWNAYHKLVYLADQNSDYDIFAGVYCVKTDPAVPLIYKGWDSGPFWDWTVGDVLKDGITGVGMGCTLLRLSMFEKLTNTPEKPWFKTKNLADYDAKSPVFGQISEDLFLCRRAVSELGSKIMVDTGIQCGHINNNTGVIYTLPQDCLPVKRAGITMEENKGKD